MNGRASLCESLNAAGYIYNIKIAATKQLALQACYHGKFDLVISNCITSRRTGF